MASAGGEELAGRNLSVLGASLMAAIRPDLGAPIDTIPVAVRCMIGPCEITDGVDVARMPELRESVRASMARASKVLDHLIRHAGRTARANSADRPG